MWLEACAQAATDFPRLPLADRRGGHRADRLGAPARWPLGDRARPAAERAGACARVAGRRDRRGSARRSAQRTGAEVVGLTGGVFQNRLLSGTGRVGPARARLPGAARGTRALQRRRPELRPGRRFSRPKRINCRRCSGSNARFSPSCATNTRRRCGSRRTTPPRSCPARRRRPASCTCTCRSARCCARSARSTASATTRSKTHRYFEALRREIRLYHDHGFRFGDVYVGGGTPTVDADELIETLELVRSLSPVHAVSIETNPNHLDRDDARALPRGRRDAPLGRRAELRRRPARRHGAARQVRQRRA